MSGAVLPDKGKSVSQTVYLSCLSVYQEFRLHKKRENSDTLAHVFIFLTPLTQITRIIAAIATDSTENGMKNVFYQAAPPFSTTKK